MARRTRIVMFGTARSVFLLLSFLLAVKSRYRGRDTVLTWSGGYIEGELIDSILSSAASAFDLNAICDVGDDGWQAREVNFFDWSLDGVLFLVGGLGSFSLRDIFGMVAGVAVSVFAILLSVSSVSVSAS